MLVLMRGPNHVFIIGSGAIAERPDEVCGKGDVADNEADTASSVALKLRVSILGPQAPLDTMFVHEFAGDSPSSQCQVSRLHRW